MPIHGKTKDMSDASKRSPDGGWRLTAIHDGIDLLWTERLQEVVARRSGYIWIRDFGAFGRRQPP